MDAEALIKKFDLMPHPEGGFFRETYRADLSAGFEGFNGPRSASTGIYFLLPSGTRSCLHRIKSDEMWHFYLGGPMHLVEIGEDGALKETILGSDIAAGEVVQHVVPAGVWFGGAPLEGSSFSFVGCTVAPGFDFQDFEMGRQADLLSRFPEHAQYIRVLS
ncbi:MAG: cupin domain-containing protein [Alphaproteobacteria bacterium]|nr:cupin domain-containing protein [Alphaproteobacteria bacterium]MCD8519939.1 cupin domain-containing protein [Alphaproteobacteria bacterium]MCD8570688.1 cupin domain-containing protein [Alphaproteobacteria bacterium]